MLNTKRNTELGFTLIECVIAMVVSLVGLLAVYSLVVTAIQMQTVSRNLTVADSFARAKVEGLKGSTRTVGGSLTSNVSGYFDTPSARYFRRWQISNDAMGTQTVSIAVIPSTPGRLQPQVTLRTRMR